MRHKDVTKEESMSEQNYMSKEEEQEQSQENNKSEETGYLHLKARQTFLHLLQY